MYRLVIACVLALLVALAGTALTKMPDHHPDHHPPFETACTGLWGGARGLCNAYCQAQDCDVHQRPSCELLRKAFKRVTGSSKFPCDRVACGQSEPQCNGDCPTGFVCASGPETGGPEGGGPEGPGPHRPCRGHWGRFRPRHWFPRHHDGVAICTCMVPCGEAQAPQCAGGCPLGTVCSSGPENGGAEGGPEAATCACKVPCGGAVAPTCNGACPPGAVCAAGAEGGPEAGTCSCLF